MPGEARRPGGWFGGGGGGGGGFDQGPPPPPGFHAPPPYSEKDRYAYVFWKRLNVMKKISSFRRASAPPYTSGFGGTGGGPGGAGFWTGLGAGGLMGYLMGNQG